MKLNRLMITPPEGIKIQGVIQIIHGMCEHKERYIDTMKYLSLGGYVCIISDLPGHGENVSSPDELGYFGKNGVDSLLSCVHQNTLFIKEHFPDIPYTLLGHSMGSLICRSYLKKYDNYPDYAIICGSPSNNILVPLADAIINTLITFTGGKTKSNFVKNLCTGSFESNFKSEKTENSWICSDNDVVKAYNKDQLCGFTFTLNGYLTLTRLLRSVYSKNGWQLHNPNLPLLFISGEEDPCMTDIKHWKEAIQLMKVVGYKNVHYKLYPGLRHEILNEVNKEIVYNDIINFIS